MAEIMGTMLGQKVIVRYRNFDQSISFKLSEDADVNIGGAIIHRLSERSVYEYTEELGDTNGTLMIQIKTAGLPGFTYGEIFEYNDAYYISDDVVHTYSVDAGYLTEIYAHRFVEGWWWDRR